MKAHCNRICFKQNACKDALILLSYPEKITFVLNGIAGLAW